MTAELDPLHEAINEAIMRWIRNPNDPRVLSALINAQVELNKRIHAGWVAWESGDQPSD